MQHVAAMFSISAAAAAAADRAPREHQNAVT
jgi:hypothetical protein